MVNVVGILGAGKMGVAMARNFAAAGVRVVAFDPLPAARERVAAEGMEVVESLKALGSHPDVDAVLSIVPNDAALRGAVEGADGLASTMREGTVHVCAATVSPHTAREMAKIHDASGKSTYVGSPIFARPDGVAQKQGSFCLGGAASAVEKVEPLLRLTAKDCFNFGDDPGAGNVVKLCGNFMIASAIESISEALALAESNGADREAVMEMLSSTIFDCLIYKGYGERVSKRLHLPRETNFGLELGLKDVDLVMDTARKSDTSMPFASILQSRYLAAYNRGMGDLDWSALGLTASEDSGTKAEPK